MKKSILGIAIALSFVFVPLALRAQQNPLTSAIREAVSRDGRNLTAGAEEMPADKFGYAPTPAQMTFGHLMLHIAQSNGFLCSSISGDQAPALGNLTDTSPKERLVDAVRASFAFCDQALAKVSDSDLSAQVKSFGGRTASKAAVMVALSNDLADHYAQESIYLRLNGHLPPTAMGRGMGMGRGRRGGM